MMAALLSSTSCEKADNLDNSTDQLTKLDDTRIQVYTDLPNDFIKHEAVYDETRTVIYFDGKNAGKMKKAFYDAGIRMSVVMGMFPDRRIQLSSDFLNFDEVIDFDGLVFASVGTSVENAYTFPGVEYASPFIHFTDMPGASNVPIERYVTVPITSSEKLEELKKMVDEYGLEFCFVPESGIGDYTVMCNRNSKVNGALFGNALIESKLFGGVRYCMQHLSMGCIGSENYEEWRDHPYGCAGYGGSVYLDYFPTNYLLSMDDAIFKELFGDLYGFYDHYNIHPKGLN